MKTKVIYFMSSLLVIFSTFSCLKVPDEKISPPPIDEKEIIIPNPNFDTKTQNNLSIPYAVTIKYLTNGQVSVDNPYKDKGVTVNVDRQHVTVISTTTSVEVNYVLSGNSTNSSLKIYSELRFGVVMNGVGLQNPKGAALNIQSGRRVTVTLVDNTMNRLVDEGVFEMTENERMNGTFFSEGQLIFNGAGSLLVYGNHGHAINVRDYIRINNGSITVFHANSDGIQCRDFFEINGGSVNINAKSDGIESARQYIDINGGAIKIKAGNKGLKAVENITITGGRLEIESQEDGIRSENDVIITGGEVYSNSRDGILSTGGSIAISGGRTVLAARRNAFSCTKTFSMTGGTAVGTGRSTTIPTASSSKQRSVVWGASDFKDQQLIYIRRSDTDAEVLTLKLSRAYPENMALVFTAPSLEANMNYLIYKGGNIPSNNHFHGLYNDGKSNGGELMTIFTTSDMVTPTGDTTVWN